MRLEAKSGLRGKFFDAATGAPVRFVKWYDAGTHEFEAFRSDPAAAGAVPRALLYRGKGPLRFVPAAPAPALKPGGTPLEEIRREVLKGRVPRAAPLLALPGVPAPECDEPGCHRPAEWSVLHEQLVEPERGADGLLHERAVGTDLRVWCSWHYRPPVQTSERGVESEVEVTARPQ